ncbi:MAG: CcdB family protein [Geminicoccaceae bacterium]
MPRPRIARQFDVVVNPAARVRRQLPYLVVLQSDFADTGDERVVAPLSPVSEFKPATQRLFPTVALEGTAYRLLVPGLATARVGSLMQPVGSLASERDRIIAALDYLFLGF